MTQYLITTKRLGFRLLQEKDIHHWEKLYADPEVTQFLSTKNRNKAVMQNHINHLVQNYSKTKLPCFMIFDLHKEEFVGRAGFGKHETGDVEVGYVLHKKFWGQGLATEALAALLDWAKVNIDAEYILAFTPIEHHASQRVLIKCGMKFYKNDLDKGEECRFYRILNK